MPIQLATPFDPGSFDPGQEYAQVAIERAEFSLDNVKLTCRYGNTVSGQWERGIAGSDMVYNVTNEDPGFDVNALVATGAALQTSGDPIPDEFYQWLIDAGHFAGSIL